MFQETLLMLTEYAKCSSGDYSRVSLDFDIPNEAQAKAIMMFGKLKSVVKSYQDAAPLLDVDTSIRGIMNIILLFVI